MYCILHKAAALGALLFAGAFLPATAQEWSPSKPIRIIVPIVGSTNDAIARLVAPKLQEALGQPVIVENKPGAGGNIGADFVAKSVPDGHTLLVGYNGPIAINVTLFDKMSYDPLRDLTPITLAVTSPQYLVVHPSVGVNTVGEFIVKAKRAAVCSGRATEADRFDWREAFPRHSECANACRIRLFRPGRHLLGRLPCPKRNAQNRLSTASTGRSCAS